MTRKELVDALTANFAEDEEVTFVYNDDQGEVRETKVEIREHEQETYKGHWEYKGVLVGDYADIRKMYKTGIDMRGERCSYSDLCHFSLEMDIVRIKLDLSSLMSVQFIRVNGLDRLKGISHDLLHAVCVPVSSGTEG